MKGRRSPEPVLLHVLGWVCYLWGLGSLVWSVSVGDWWNAYVSMVCAAVGSGVFGLLLASRDDRR
jgi:hypothetical protein